MKPAISLREQDGGKSKGPAVMAGIVSVTPAKAEPTSTALSYQLNVGAR